ncbi:hypothetical protein [Roseiterribacter gracilis]|uniref:hypothetical protein n=1 Tax=Roseiterribacter gracilis TaxID=2812848 RepID=UPI003B4347E7
MDAAIPRQHGGILPPPFDACAKRFSFRHLHAFGAAKFDPGSQTSSCFKQNESQHDFRLNDIPMIASPNGWPENITA